MSKDSERLYLDAIGSAGRNHAKYKPFSNHDCGQTLAGIGTVMKLMPAPPARVLDLGCGSGWTSLFFARRGYEVVGVDLAETMIALAEELRAEELPGAPVQFMASDYESLEFADHFDCAVFFDCLHHAEDEKAAIHSAWRALKPGGLLITHEPGVGHSRSPDSVRAMELYGVNERDMPPERIIAAARAIGFTEWRIYPLPQVVINRFYRLEPNPWLFSPAGMRRALHLLRMAFFPSAKAGAIVVLKK